MFTFIILLSMSHAACSPAATDSAAGDGQMWVLYDAERDNGSGTFEKGTVKVSIVGKEAVSGAEYTWFEFDETFGAQREITKVLAKQADAFDPAQSFLFITDVKKIIVKTGDKPAQLVPDAQIRKFTPSFVESKQTRKFQNATDIMPAKSESLPEETLLVAGKDMKCSRTKMSRKFVSKVNLGFIHIEDTTTMETEMWQNPDVPFAPHLVKINHQSSTVSENKIKPDEPQKPPFQYKLNLTLKEFGTSGAVSAITGEPQQMEAPVFPFLKQGVQPPKPAEQPPAAPAAAAPAAAAPAAAEPAAAEPAAAEPVVVPADQPPAKDEPKTETNQ